MEKVQSLFFRANYLHVSEEIELERSRRTWEIKERVLIQQTDTHRTRIRNEKIKETPRSNNSATLEICARLPFM